jgi:putative ABC transport system permease protein
MLVYLRLLKESFAFMDALRSNMLRTLLSLLGVTIEFFNHSCTCCCGLIGPKDL